MYVMLVIPVQQLLVSSMLFPVEELLPRPFRLV